MGGGIKKKYEHVFYIRRYAGVQIPHWPVYSFVLVLILGVVQNKWGSV